MLQTSIEIIEGIQRKERSFEEIVLEPSKTALEKSQAELIQRRIWIKEYLKQLKNVKR